MRIGPGLQQADGRIVADRAGVVRSAPGGKLWLDVRQKRWVCLAVVWWRTPWCIRLAPLMWDLHNICKGGLRGWQAVQWPAAPSPRALACSGISGISASHWLRRGHASRQLIGGARQLQGQAAETVSRGWWPTPGPHAVNNKAHEGCSYEVVGVFFVRYTPAAGEGVVGIKMERH